MYKCDLTDWAISHLALFGGRRLAERLRRRFDAA